MSSVNLIGWFIVIPLLAILLWFVWWVWNANFVLDKKLASGDLALLTSTSYKVDEVIRAPAGSRVDAVTQVLGVVGNMRMMPMQLPDGRVMMVPVRVEGGLPSMHTNQQLPIQQKSLEQ